MFVNRFQMWQGSTATIFLVSNSTPIARKARAAPLLIYVFFPLSLPPRSLVLDEISLGWKSSPYLWPCGMSVVDANFFPPHALPFFPFGILHTTQRRRCFPFLVSFFSTISSCLCFFLVPLGPLILVRRRIARAPPYFECVVLNCAALSAGYKINGDVFWFPFLTAQTKKNPTRCCLIDSFRQQVAIVEKYETEIGSCSCKGIILIRFHWKQNDGSISLINALFKRNKKWKLSKNQ